MNFLGEDKGRSQRGMSVLEKLEKAREEYKMDYLMNYNLEKLKSRDQIYRQEAIERATNAYDTLVNFEINEHERDIFNELDLKKESNQMKFSSQGYNAKVIGMPLTVSLLEVFDVSRV